MHNSYSPRISLNIIIGRLLLTSPSWVKSLGEKVQSKTEKMAATFLPAPRHSYNVHTDEPSPSSVLAPSETKKKVPPYGHRQGFVPRSVEDFGDGGAFPEIHAAQFPLDMGRPAKKKAGAGSGSGAGVGGISGLGNNSGSTAIVAVDVDETGKVRPDLFTSLSFRESVFSPPKRETGSQLISRHEKNERGEMWLDNDGPKSRSIFTVSVNIGN